MQLFWPSASLIDNLLVGPECSLSLIPCTSLLSTNQESKELPTATLLSGNTTNYQITSKQFSARLYRHSMFEQRLEQTTCTPEDNNKIKTYVQRIYTKNSVFVAATSPPPVSSKCILMESWTVSTMPLIRTLSTKSAITRKALRERETLLSQVEILNHLLTIWGFGRRLTRVLITKLFRSERDAASCNLAYILKAKETIETDCQTHLISCPSKERDLKGTCWMHHGWRRYGGYISVVWVSMGSADDR